MRKGEGKGKGEIGVGSREERRQRGGDQGEEG